MLRTYFLITNTSGLKYWSYLGTPDNTVGILASMVEKHGNIYVNDKDGWFTQNCVKEVHAVLIQENFPTNIF
jgi:hypothetical protein